MRAGGGGAGRLPRLEGEGGEEVERALAEVRVGDVVSLAGTLVDLEIRDQEGRLRFRNRTSLTRTDVGSGACEQMWVEAVAADRPE